LFELIKSTFTKYFLYRTAKPLLGPEEFTTTTQLAQAFGAPGGAGEKLQQLLEQKANNEPNWVTCGLVNSSLCIAIHI